MINRLRAQNVPFMRENGTFMRFHVLFMRGNGSFMRLGSVPFMRLGAAVGMNFIHVWLRFCWVFQCQYVKTNHLTGVLRV